MPKDLLDFERVRRNFDRMRDPVPESIPDRFASVRPPLDPFVAARDALAKLRKEALAGFPDRHEALVPFLDRAAAIVERLAGSDPKPDNKGNASEGKEAEEPADLRAELVEQIQNVEDLCEAFAQRGRA
jgi:hypothetical protein